MIENTVKIGTRKVRVLQIGLERRFAQVRGEIRVNLKERLRGGVELASILSDGIPKAGVRKRVSIFFRNIRSRAVHLPGGKILREIYVHKRRVRVLWLLGLVLHYLRRIYLELLPLHYSILIASNKDSG